MRVVLNRSDAIGDLILTLPMLAAIKLRHPQAQTAMIVSKKCVDLVRENKLVDDYFVWDTNLSPILNFFRLNRFLKKFKPTHFFHVGGTWWPQFVTFLRAVAFRGGLISKWASYLFLNHGVRQSRSMVVMHETEYNLELLKTAGIELSQQEIAEVKKNVLQVSGEAAREASEKLQKYLQENNHPVGREMIVIHPGMTGHTLNWSARNYGRLIVRLEHELPGRFLFLVSHTPSDRRYVDGIKEIMRERGSAFQDNNVVYFNGSETGLLNYLALLSLASLVVAGSTGPAHMANALGVPGVYIYSPIKVQSALRWGPANRQNQYTKVVVPDVVCGEQFKCAGDLCPYYECMAKIEVEEIFRYGLGMLGKGKSNDHDQATKSVTL